MIATLTFSSSITQNNIHSKLVFILTPWHCYTIEMPKSSSLFSKLQVRLRRLPRLDGPDSTDDDQEQEEEELTNKLGGDHIVDSAPKGSALGSKPVRHPPRAVRFCEDLVMPPSPLAIGTGEMSQCSPFPQKSPLQSQQQQQLSSPDHSSFHNEPAALQPKNGWSDSMTAANGISENLQPPRPARTNRANLLLQQLRTSNELQAEDDAAASGRVDMRTAKARIGEAPSSMPVVVFLEHQGETKRSLIPPNLRSLSQLKSLFFRSFPSLNAAHMQTSLVKVYIQKMDSPHGLFYELEDVRDLEDQCVLRLFGPSSSHQNIASQASPVSSPPLLQPTMMMMNLARHQQQRQQQPLECLSEPETLEWKGIGQKGTSGRELAQLRPASVLGNRNGCELMRQQQHRNSNSNKNTNRMDAIYWGGNSSDSSCYSTGAHYPKSGSSTPQIMEQDQTRRKVDNLERQLASLCSLVHSALFPASHETQKELAQLNAEILDKTTIGSANSAINSQNASNPLQNGYMADSTSSTIAKQLNWQRVAPGHQREEAQKFDRMFDHFRILRAEMADLKRGAQQLALNSDGMIQKALEKVRGTLEHRKGMMASDTSLISSFFVSSTAQQQRLVNVQSALRTFEASLENTRSAVLNSTRRLKLKDVDALTARLGEIGRETVKLKVEIPILQRQLNVEMRTTMERMANEERILREKMPLVDACLRRCKVLANMMVTMKKLAIIQDVEQQTFVAGETCRMPERRAIPIRHISLQNYTPLSLADQQPLHQIKCVDTAAAAGDHPLDAILDELNGNAGINHQNFETNEVSASFTLRFATA